MQISKKFQPHITISLNSASLLLQFAQIPRQEYLVKSMLLSTYLKLKIKMNPLSSEALGIMHKGIYRSAPLESMYTCAGLA